MNNSQIADRLDEIADLLEIQGGNQYRVRSYRTGARTVRNLGQPVRDMLADSEDLSALPGIGQSLADKIATLVDTGELEQLEQLRREVPGELGTLLQVQGLGPRTLQQLHRELGISDRAGLRRAAEQGRIGELEGLGPKTEQNILHGLELLERHHGRIGIRAASEQVDELGAYLDGLDAIGRWVVAGSYRRRRETVGDLDVLVRADDREAAAAGILDYPQLDEVIGRGQEKISLRLRDGLQVDFRFFEARAFGAALMYFTGSKAHNVALRGRAQEHDWKLNEYGLFTGDRLLAGRSEKAVYRKLGLDWIPPELRENRGEIEAAAAGRLPRLVELSHLRGDLHVHTDASDGRAGIEQMAAAARERGYEYLAITDHSKAVSVTGGLDAERLAAHAERIRALDDELDDLLLLAGIEVDILADGRLDLPDESLAELDWVVASVHSHFDQSEKRMTERLLAAIDSGLVDCLGHPTGRMIGKRDPIAFDFERVLAACAERGVRLEINAHPERLDLPPELCQRAAAAGVELVIVTDAHAAADLDLLEYGVWSARRGWLGRRDVFNTIRAESVAKRLRGRKKK